MSLEICAFNEARDRFTPLGQCQAGRVRIVSGDVSSGDTEALVCKVADDESLAGIHRVKAESLFHSEHPQLVAANLCTNENLEALMIDNESYETDVVSPRGEKWHLIFRHMVSVINPETA